MHLPDDAFDRPRPADRFGCSPLRLVTVGRLQPEKGHRYLLEAIAKLTCLGRDLRCEFVGDGRRRDELEQMAGGMGIADRVEFHGQIAMGDSVRAILRGCDLFVLPSLTEGLGRALLEAMALGLPCLGSDTGGIPELLPADCLVRPGSASSLAETIDRVGKDPATLARMSAENFDKAGQYRNEVLRVKQREFWHCIREQSEHHAVDPRT
jgi:glycosyltransferase involved in cell wall biosynthesis